MNYVIGALQKKLPRAPLPFNPALIDCSIHEMLSATWPRWQNAGSLCSLVKI